MWRYLIDLHEVTELCRNIRNPLITVCSLKVRWKLLSILSYLGATRWFFIFLGIKQSVQGVIGSLVLCQLINVKIHQKHCWWDGAVQPEARPITQEKQPCTDGKEHKKKNNKSEQKVLETQNWHRRGLSWLWSRATTGILKG